MKERFINYWTVRRIILLFIFLTGVFVRLIYIGTYPLGLNQDEAAAGYDAFAILRYGIDRNGISYPVHFISWGSGQNAAYSYLCMPFIALFGLSEFSIRLPMALMGCASIYVVYRISKNMFKGNMIIIVTAIFAICPWHIMKSRWALESNVFPDLILLFVWFITEYIKCGKKRWIYCGAVILALSAYSYGTSYCFIPVFVVPVIVVMIKKKMCKITDVVGAAFLSLIIAFPMILFVIINTFDLEQISIGAVTIPKLYVSRHMEITSVFSGDFLSITKENLKQTLGILLKQEDGLYWNYIVYYGINYVFSLPFTIIGIVICLRPGKFKELFINKRLCILLDAWFFGALVVSCVVDPNINRINIIMIPLVLYSGIGVGFVIDRCYQVKWTIIAMYACFFVTFSINYFGEYQQGMKSCFYYTLADAIKYTKELNKDVVYVSSQINMPYIFTLFYDEENPYNFIDTVEYYNRYSAFEMVESYGKYRFYIPDMKYVDEDENNAFIVETDRVSDFDLSRYSIRVFSNYSVIYN